MHLFVVKITLISIALTVQYPYVKSMFVIVKIVKRIYVLIALIGVMMKKKIMVFYSALNAKKKTAACWKHASKRAQTPINCFNCKITTRKTNQEETTMEEGPKVVTERPPIPDHPFHQLSELWIINLLMKSLLNWR